MTILLNTLFFAISISHFGADILNGSVGGVLWMGVCFSLAALNSGPGALAAFALLAGVLRE